MLPKHTPFKPFPSLYSDRLLVGQFPSPIGIPYEAPSAGHVFRHPTFILVSKMVGERSKLMQFSAALQLRAPSRLARGPLP
jgi:hypothetical protein